MNSLQAAVENLIYVLYEHGDLSSKLIRDRHYAFWQFYELRTIMLIMISNSVPDLCFKAREHSDGTMFNNDFILGINTELGLSTYHIKNMYFECFNVKEVDSSPIWDGYTQEDNLNRTKSIILPKNYIQTEEEVPYIPFIPPTSEFSDQMACNINGLLELLRNYEKIDLNNIGDGHHRFEFLYRQRRALINIFGQQYKEFVYKSQFDINGNPIPNNKFIVGIKVPGEDIFQVFGNPRFNEFDLPILETAPVDSKVIITEDHELLDALHENFCQKILSLKVRKYH